MDGDQPAALGDGGVAGAGGPAPGGEEAPRRRGRGRPPGSGAGARAKLAPRTLPPAQPGPEIKRAARPRVAPGAAPASASAGPSKALVDKVERLHTAASASIPELALTRSEAEDVSGALDTLLRSIGIDPDAKSFGLLGALIALATIYGPRAVIIAVRRRAAGEKVGANNAPDRPAPKIPPISAVPRAGFAPAHGVAQAA